MWLSYSPARTDIKSRIKCGKGKLTYHGFMSTWLGGPEPQNPNLRSNSSKEKLNCAVGSNKISWFNNQTAQNGDVRPLQAIR